MDDIRFAADMVVLAGSVVTALGIICGLFWRFTRRVTKILESQRSKEEFSDYCDKWTLRMAIVNPCFLDSERLEAFEVYKEHGGNGYMVEYAEGIRQRMKDKVNTKIEGEMR